MASSVTFAARGPIGQAPLDVTDGPPTLEPSTILYGAESDTGDDEPPVLEPSVDEAYQMAFKIRTSKFRHVYGESHRKENCYENIRLTRNAHDSNFCAVNPKSLAVVTECAGGGSFVVLPIAQTGRVDINAPRVCGHSGNVLDIKWNPFNDDIIASGSDDNTVKVWQIPDTGLQSNLTEWQVDLHGHGRRVGYIDWHPTAENIILSAGMDYKCIIWNVEQAEPVNVISCHDDVVQSISWNRDGSLFSTTCKDKKLRLIDPRLGNCCGVSGVDLFSAVRPSKCVWLGDTGKIFSVGFSRSGEREYAIWDVRNLKRDVKRQAVDSSNGILLPFYDHDTRILFLAGKEVYMRFTDLRKVMFTDAEGGGEHHFSKGDGNIRYFEMVDSDPYCHYLSNYSSSAPQRGLGVMPKRGCDTSKCEIMRFYKLHAARNFVEPVSMIVPRKSGTFQEDIFPPTASAIASLSADEWITGQNREPILISMKDIGLSQAPTITTYKAVNQSSSSQKSHGPTGSAPDVKKQPEMKTPASLRNIKCLSLNDDIVVLAPTKEKQAKTSHSPVSVEDGSGDKAFVNNKIAAFENKRGSKSEQDVVSPTRRRFPQRSWSSSQDPPPDVIANGIKGSSKGTSQNGSEPMNVENTGKPSNEALYNVENAGKYFENTNIEIIDIPRPETPEKTIQQTPNGESQSAKSSRFGSRVSSDRLILGKFSAESPKENGHHKVHVKKVWSPVAPPTSPKWQDSPGAPTTDPELRKAYFRQVEELKSQREQINLKDKRIRQLEEELNILRKGVTPHGESQC